MTPQSLALEVYDAWHEYLEATRELRDERYLEAEPWAWTQLRSRLANVAKREKVAA